MSKRYIDLILDSEPNIPKDYDPAENLFVHPGSPYNRGTPIPPEEMKQILQGLREHKFRKLSAMRKKKAQSED